MHPRNLDKIIKFRVSTEQHLYVYIAVNNYLFVITPF